MMKHELHGKKFKRNITSRITIEKKVYRVIEFNEEAWLKPYIDMNTELRKNKKNDLEKYFEIQVDQ